MTWQRALLVILTILIVLLGGFICYKRSGGAADLKKALSSLPGLPGKDRSHSSANDDAFAGEPEGTDQPDGAPEAKSSEEVSQTESPAALQQPVAPPPGGFQAVAGRVAALSRYATERMEARADFLQSLKELGPYPSSRPLSTFLRDSRSYQERYTALKARYENRLQAITTAEDVELQSIYDEASRLDALTGSSALRIQARNAIAAKRGERQAAHRKMQADLDVAGSRQGRAFKEGFQQRLAEDTGRLSPEERRSALRKVRSDVENIYGRSPDPVVRAARNYSVQWIDFFAREEKPAVKPEKPVKVAEVDRVVTAAGVRAEKKPFARVRECKDLPDVSLADYREYLSSLSRTCHGAFLPDVVIDECREGNPSVDISSRCQRNIFSFLLFDSNNYVDRMRGWRHFAENCVQHRPALELARSMLAQTGRLDSFSRQRIQAGLERLEGCR